MLSGGFNLPQIANARNSSARIDYFGRWWLYKDDYLQNGKFLEVDKTIMCAFIRFCKDILNTILL